MTTKHKINQIWSEVNQGKVQYRTDQGLRPVKSIRAKYGKAIEMTVDSKLITINENNADDVYAKCVFF